MSSPTPSRRATLLMFALTVLVPAHAFLPFYAATLHSHRGADLRAARSGVTCGNRGPMGPRGLRGGGLPGMMAMTVGGGGQAPMRDILVAGAGPAGLGSALELDKVLNTGDQARFRITVRAPDLTSTREATVSLPVRFFDRAPLGCRE